MQMVGVFAEFEREMIRERTPADLRANARRIIFFYRVLQSEIRLA